MRSQRTRMLMMIRFLSRSQRIRRPVEGEKGIVLIEVLAAIAILGVVAVGFLSALTTAYGAIIVADRHTRAESLTRTAFEYMRSLPYDHSSNFSGSGALPLSWQDPADEQSGYPYLTDNNRDYRVQVTSSKLEDNSTWEIVLVVLYRDNAVSTTTTYRSDPNRIV